MPAFHYSALNQAQRTIKGVIQAENPRQARQQLRDQQLTPLSVNEVKRLPRRQRRLKAGDLALTMRQLATLIQADLPLADALQTVAAEQRQARIRGWLMGLRGAILEGHGFATALQQGSEQLPEIYQATIAAGEQSGHLAMVLENLAQYSEDRQAMQRRIMLALLYPAVLVVVAVLIIVGLLVYVVPQVVQVFQSQSATLPWITQALIATSDFLSAWGWWLLALLVGAGLLGRWLLSQAHWQQRWHRLLLKLPIIGALFRGFNGARFCRTMAILAQSGVSILDALTISGQVVTCLPMRANVLSARDQVREGSSLHQALQQGGFFPPMTVQMIASGEASGRLQALLSRAADQQEKSAESLTSTLLGLFEPVLILTMGLVVLTIVLAILLPIFELNQMVGM